MMKSFFAVFVTGALLFGGAVCTAEEDNSLFVKKDKSYQHKDWTVELGSGVTFGSVREPDDADVSYDYTIVPVETTVALAVDEVSLDEFAGGVFRGYTDFLVRGYHDVIVNGYENRISGLNFGPRYNFVQEGWKWIPYAEGVVGVGFTDSQYAKENDLWAGLGQDFCFMFGVGMGVRYDISEDWFLRMGGMYHHFSNGGLSEPERNNRPIDNAGPVMSVGYRF